MIETNKAFVKVNTYDSLSGMDKITNSQGNITLLPNDLSTIKIYVQYPDGHLNEIKNFESVLSDYNVTMGTAFPTLNDHYDLVFVAFWAWSVTGYRVNDLNKLFNSGVNLITIGDDTNDIMLIKDFYNPNVISTFSNIHPVVDNLITRKFDLKDFSENQTYIHFKDDVEIWYRGTYDDTSYDAIGYYFKNNTEWIHSQYALLDLNMYKALIDYIYPQNGITYEFTKSGTYKITAYDKAGNIIEKTINVEIP